MNKIFFVALGIVGMTLTNCSREQPKRELPPVKVQAGEVKEQPVRYSVEAIGYVNQNLLVQIRPQVEGILLKVYAQEGSLVKEGDLLYEIDSRPFQAALDQAEANLKKDIAALAIAKSTAERYAVPASKDYVSPLVYEQYLTNVKIAEAQIAVDQAAIETAKINLGYCRITAPISGKTSSYTVDIGNFVAVNNTTPLIEIRQIQPVQIAFSIPQKDFQEIKNFFEKIEELKFDVILPYAENSKVEGELYFVDNHIDDNTGTILLKGLVANEELVLWPGEYARVRLYFRTDPKAIVIPYSALLQGQKGPYVYVINEDMTVKTVNIETGLQFDSSVVVKTGLKIGDRLVTNGQLNLRNGSKVIVESK